MFSGSPQSEIHKSCVESIGNLRGKFDLALRSITKGRGQREKSIEDKHGKGLQHLGSNTEMAWKSSGKERTSFSTDIFACFFLFVFGIFFALRETR